MRNFILILFALIVITSCVKRKTQEEMHPSSPQPKYALGAVVYVKPDSTAAVVRDWQYSGNNDDQVQYELVAGTNSESFLRYEYELY